MGFDKLFGKGHQEENARLKEEIAELQGELEELRGEKEKLDKKLEKQKRRVKNVESEKQGLYEKINRQEDRIQSLKNELQDETVSESESQELKDVEPILWEDPAVATLDRKRIEDYRLVKADIKSKHSKGGFSQDRFRRRREEEVKEHIDNVEKVTEELPDTDFMALSGSPKMVSELEKKDLVRRFRDKTFRKRLDLSNVNEEKDLKKATHKFWRVEIINL